MAGKKNRGRELAENGSAPAVTAEPKAETAPSPEEAASPYEHLLTALRYESSRGPLRPFGALYRFFLYQWELINRASLEKPQMDSPVEPGNDGRGGRAYQTSPIPLLVLVVASFSLTLMEYYGSSRDFFNFLKGISPSSDFSAWAKGILSGPNRELYGFVYWSLARFVGYMLIPCVAVWLFLRKESVLSYGLSLKNAQSHTRLYVTLYLMIAPVVFLVSYTAGFQKTYPFYSLASRSMFDFFVFEAFYAFQFLTLEFFFRGFLLHSIKRYVGAYAIFIMLVPYCMIHFGKPMSETLGAIGAGLILGTISLRTNSIWGGFGIHVAVAISMDLSSLWQKGLL